MQFNLESALCTKCKKPLPLQRHHTGCEHMWLVHFKEQENTRRYQDFKERYYSFEAADLVLLCRPCHKKIHRHYLAIIRRLIEESGYNALKNWTWEEAEAMMTVLRLSCRKWIASK